METSLKASKSPPRFVPTLTEVVAEQTHRDPAPPLLLPQPKPVIDAPAPKPKPEPEPKPELKPQPPPKVLAIAPPPEGLQEEWIQQVLQRVDTALDARVRDTIATVVQEQTRLMLLRLGDEIEWVVRQVVREAIQHQDRGTGTPIGASVVSPD